jgi:hypothetical protein
LREGTAFNITGSGCEPFRFGSDRVTSLDRVGVAGDWKGGGGGYNGLEPVDGGGGSVAAGFSSTSTAVCLPAEKKHTNEKITPMNKLGSARRPFLDESIQNINITVVMNFN